MRVDHGRFEMCMAQEGLYRADIVAVFEEMHREAVPEDVNGIPFNQLLGEER